MKMGVISYDITHSKTRNNLYRILSSYCTRVQFSVFEFELKNEIYNELMERINNLVTKYNNDLKKENKFTFSIRIYFLCSTCKNKILNIGDDVQYYKKVTIV